MIELSDYTVKKADKINQENQKNAATAITILIGTVVIAVVLLTVVGIAITNMITSPVKKLQELMSRAEAGDLTVQGDYNAKDEIGQLNGSFNGMLTAFKDTVSRDTLRSRQCIRSIAANFRKHRGNCQRQQQSGPSRRKR